MMTGVVDRLHLSWEANFPAILGAVAALGAVFCAPSVYAYVAAKGGEMGELYSAIFDVSAITTPFLFTVYSFVISTDRGFIGRAKASMYYEMMVRYTITALVLGALLTIGSIPMLIMKPVDLHAVSDPIYFMVVVWYGLAVWTLAAFVRATYLFSLFARQHA